ncbi:MAG: hypothetical protein MZV64_25155 [Ignavibacteriales bacterium]|nr:hypothetical protein [Ignavibacteriales bacterium]
MRVGVPWRRRGGDLQLRRRAVVRAAAAAPAGPAPGRGAGRSGARRGARPAGAGPRGHAEPARRLLSGGISRRSG